ncbi:hypothetical protein [Mesonia aestuariivivens]|uniref:Uncharacterized protein n=1 Tax=Mesonia aestuariivivens TaxID=2796128 RepID=A0ABS6W7B9_9FLAO|nr:hypothetical protein [Mesonia aestuariivivens]MBW2963013.1 hypothetical protein [Mesonia aestuariivivens]
MHKEFNPIFSHDDEHVISHKKNSNELDHWMAHLLFIVKEMNYLKKLSEKELTGKEYYFLKLELERKKIENNKLITTLEKYIKSRSILNECDDMECDRLFIYEHEIYRKKYDRFISTYRTTKEMLFNLLT